ncbi:MAG: Arginine-tRNA ligase [Candidatus Roizmanbacteria bacterium GW2011_GWA2_36_23]|uniref:Arginine--tRNA ligase n=1 Tax=Candidatus Roizmanbacteria bacterium GW2011_GWA2_36_23 TaxID=1618480 RepID=A0A0G0GQP8_9BACT|nr:MAG: Arginine-tRNA ligase [Candidatus Roizmanbacteria bacterium GW2011_GWA2_36_23]
MVKDKIKQNLLETLKKMNADLVDVDIDHPTNPLHGDFSSNIALQLAQTFKKNPLQIAVEIKENFPKDKFVEKIDVLKPGFINFWLSKDYLLQIVGQLDKEVLDIPKFHLGKSKRVMVEFAHPNTHKLFHIGHLRNISTGESIVRLLEAVGNEVIRTNYQGDVGLHIAKCLYGIKKTDTDINDLKTLNEKMEFIGKMYTKGTKEYEESDEAKNEIIEINRKIYNKDPEIMILWQETRQWSLDYYNQIYQRVDSHFDRYYFESELPEQAIEISQKALEKGILEKSQGAIVFVGKKYGLDTRVFINALGYPTYEGKELALAEKQLSEFGEIDKTIHVVTPEQTSFFKVTFKVEELINPKKFKNKRFHLIYEWVKLKSGKMSSREGNIIEGGWLLDEAKNKIMSKFNCQETTAEILAVAAVKYSFLKTGTRNQIAFDFDESISLEGNSAPYLIYTYVRTQSLLKKAGIGKVTVENTGNSDLNQEELTLLRMLSKFPYTVLSSAKSFSPNLIANYLFELTQAYNLFYQKNPILKADTKTKNFRLSLTRATGFIIKKGMYLLGIKTVERM